MAGLPVSFRAQLEWARANKPLVPGVGKAALSWEEIVGVAEDQVVAVKYITDEERTAMMTPGLV